MTKLYGALEKNLFKTTTVVNSALNACLPPSSSCPRKLHRAMRYAVFSGGKRLRPYLTLSCCRLAGGSEKKALPAACAIELLHAYSLIHDDLPCMDDSDYRRGRPSCHRVFGEATALLAGTGLMAQAFYIFSFVQPARLKPVERERAFQVLFEVSKAVGSQGLMGGQSLDLTGNFKSAPALLNMYKMKTGALIKAAVRTGAILGGASPHQLKNLTRFAHHFGLLFQLADDLMDAEEEKKKNTFVAFCGIRKSKASMDRLTRLCLSSLSPFGDAALPIRQLVQYVRSKSVTCTPKGL